MRRCSMMVAAVLLCVLAVPGYGQVIGNWEGAMDGWIVSPTAPPGSTTAFSTTGATLGSQSLRYTPGEGDYKNALVYSFNTPALQSAFFDNAMFSMDVTRIASEWQGNPSNGYCGVHLIVNAGSNAGTTWTLYQAVGGSAWWNYTNGDTTATAVFDYTAAKALIDRSNLQWLEFLVITNSDPLYTTVGSYYLDNARLEPPPPQLPLLGDWENRADTWYKWGSYPTFGYSNTTGVTLNNYSLKLTFNATGWQNGPVLALEGNNARIDAFLANSVFTMDVTRIASEWTRLGSGNHWCHLNFVVNAGFTDGTPAIWGNCGDAGEWDSNTGDSTMNLSWDYSIHKPVIEAHRNAISWFQLVLVANAEGYSGNMNYYIDSARLAPPPPQPQGYFTINTFDLADEVAEWDPPDPGNAPTTLEFDPAVDADNNPASGSMKVSINFDPNDASITEYQSIISRDMYPDLPAGVDLTEYVLFSAKVKVDPASPVDAWGSHGWSNWVLRDVSWSWDQWSAGGNVGSNSDANGWMTYRALMSEPPSPVPPRNFFRALTYQLGGQMNDADGNPFKMNGTVVVWIDNVKIGRMRPCTDPAHCELCDDKLDNNNDGKIDCDDADCPGTTWCPIEDVCDDAVDNDGDGLTNCADPDCAADPYCAHNNPFADMDGDGDVDMDDFGAVQACVGTQLPFPAGCGFLDRNGDEAIDGTDLAAFTACASGASVKADTACDGVP